MQQKVIRVGNSLAVTIPKEFVNELGIKAGQKIFVDVDGQLDTMLVRTKRTTPSITPAFKKSIEKLMKRHADAFRELARC